MSCGGSPRLFCECLSVPVHRLNGLSPRTFFATTVHTSATWPSRHPGGMTVTRTEIADTVAPSLARGPRSADEIVSFAVADALRMLPERTYPDLRSLWPHITEVPIGA